MSSPRQVREASKSTDASSHFWSFVAGAALSSFAWGCWHSYMRMNVGVGGARWMADRSRQSKTLMDTEDDDDDIVNNDCYSVDGNDRASNWSESGRRPLHLQRHGASSSTKLGNSTATLGESLRSIERQSSTVLQEWTTKLKDSCTDLMIQSLIQGEQLINRAHRRTRWPWDRKRPVIKRDKELSADDDPYSTSLKYPSPGKRYALSNSAASDQKENNGSTTPPPKKKERNRDERLHEIADVCIGSIFGLDVGGTLVKLVYFEQRDDPRQQRHNKYRSLGINNNNNLYGLTTKEKNSTIHMSLTEQDTARKNLRQQCSAEPVCQNATSRVHHSVSQNVFGTHKEKGMDGGMDGNNTKESPIHSVSYSHRKQKQRQQHELEQHQQHCQKEENDTVIAEPQQDEVHTLHEHRSISESVFGPLPLSPGSKIEPRQASSSTPASPANPRHFQNQSIPTHQYLVGESFIPMTEPPDALPQDDDNENDNLAHNELTSPPINSHVTLTSSSAPSHSGRGVMTEDCHGTNPPYLPLVYNSKGMEEEDLKNLSSSSGAAAQDSYASENSQDIFNSHSNDDDPPPCSTGGLTRSSSMVDMVLRHNSDKRMALDKFYKFAKSIDQAMKTSGDDGSSTGVKEQHLSFYSRELGGDFHFLRFETRRMSQAMNLIQTYNLHQNIYDIGATGGGAHKFSKVWQDQLGIELEKWDELESLVVGMQFVLADVVGEAYSFLPVKKGTPQSGNEQSHNNHQTRKEKSSSVTTPKWVDEWWWSRKVKRDVAAESSTYPYLLVTIGTGVSIVRVDGPRKHERISGSTIGGGTYWGLCRLLTQVDNFGDALNLAMQGDPTKVDMMVGDIYGNFKSSSSSTTDNDNGDATRNESDNNEMNETLQKLGLKSNVVASSFGKLVAKSDPASGLTEEDLARALLMMVTNNIGQVAYLNAQLHKTSRIYFVGNFLRQNQISQKRLSFAIDFWSKGQMEALFLEHEGYFGALGAFLLSQGLAPEPCPPSSSSSKRKNNSGKFSTSFAHTRSTGTSSRTMKNRRRDTVHTAPSYDTNLQKNVASDLLLNEVLPNSSTNSSNSVRNIRRTALLQHRQTTMGDSRSSQYLDEIFLVDGTDDSTAPTSRPFRQARRRSSTF